MATINFAAQEDWTVEDLHIFFHQINILYNRLYVLDEFNIDSKGKLSNLLSGSLSRVPQDKQLSVNYIEIHSPAKFSLEGVGELIGQLRGLLRDVMYDNRLDRENKEEELRHHRQMNQVSVANEKADLLEKKIKLMKQAGLPESEIQECVRKLTEPVEKIGTVMLERKVKLLEATDNT